MNSNYPDNIRDFDHDPRSPFYDDGGLEEAHVAKMKEIDGDEKLVAEIIGELKADEYTKLTKSVNDSLGVIGRFMSDALSDADAEEWQLVIAKMYKATVLPVDANLVVEEAISAYAMNEVSN